MSQYCTYYTAIYRFPRRPYLSSIRRYQSTKVLLSSLLPFLSCKLAVLFLTSLSHSCLKYVLYINNFVHIKRLKLVSVATIAMYWHICWHLHVIYPKWGKNGSLFHHSVQFRNVQRQLSTPSAPATQEMQPPSGYPFCLYRISSKTHS